MSPATPWLGVVMDNLSAHRHPAVRPLLEHAGAQLLYLPPYSPDFHPIEACWAKIKQGLRAAKTRAVDWLEKAVTTSQGQGRSGLRSRSRACCEGSFLPALPQQSSAEQLLIPMALVPSSQFAHRTPKV